MENSSKSANISMVLHWQTAIKPNFTDKPLGIQWKAFFSENLYSGIMQRKETEEKRVLSYMWVSLGESELRNTEYKRKNGTEWIHFHFIRWRKAPLILWVLSQIQIVSFSFSASFV